MNNMAKLGKYSPSRSYPDLNMAMMSSPILDKNVRDPRLRGPWTFQDQKTTSLPPFPAESAHSNSIPSAPYPNFVGTPDTGEAMTPILKYTTLQPRKLHFSPRSAFSSPKKQQRVYFGLMYPTHQAIREKTL